VAHHAGVGGPPAGSDRDVVLIRGIEPNMRWRGFCAELIELCQELEVQTVGGARCPARPTRRTPGPRR
jgi:hypothetical protein